MNMQTLIDMTAQAIAKDEEILTWCHTLYGRGHTVFVNMDIRDLPAEASCPFVAVFPDGKQAGHGRSVKLHTLGVVCGIYDENQRIHPGAANIVEYEGVKRLEAFRALVERAIAGMDLGNRLLSEINSDFETIEQFPFMEAGMLVTISEPVTLGSDYLE